MSHAITDLHLELSPATITQRPGHTLWYVTCDCTKRTRLHTRISAALDDWQTHAMGHRSGVEW